MKSEINPTRRCRQRRILTVWASLVLSAALFTVPAFAAGDYPLTIFNNLSYFIFS